MKPELKIEEMLDDTYKIVLIFKRTIEKCRDEDLLKQSELAYVFNAFAAWLLDNDEGIGKLNQLWETEGSVHNIGDKALDGLCIKIKSNCNCAEIFWSAFEQLCLKRAKESAGTAEVEKLFIKPRLEA